MEQENNGTKNFFIVVDGGEGSGKGTLLKRAALDFPEVIFTREPGGSDFGEEIRSIIFSEGAKQADEKTLFSLFWASRFEHIEKKIIPALHAHKSVISDRFDSTTFAYQVHGKNLPELEHFFWMFRSHTVKNAKPDLYIFLDLDPEIGMNRKKTGNTQWNHIDHRGLNFHKRVRDGFRIFAEKIPNEKCIFIDASQSKELVYETFADTVRNALSS